MSNPHECRFIAAGNGPDGHESRIEGRLTPDEPITQTRVLRPGQNVDPDVAGQLSSCAFRVETPTASSRESHADAPYPLQEALGSSSF